MDDILTEMFTLESPIDLITPLNPSAMFTDSFNISDIITEAKGTTKENIVQKLVSIISKALKWISNKLVEIIKALRVFFKRNTKSIDQIVSELNISPSNTIDTKDKSFSENAYKPLLISLNRDETITFRINKLYKKSQQDANPAAHKLVNQSQYIERWLTTLRYINNPELLDDWFKYFDSIVGTDTLDTLDVKLLNKLNNEFAKNKITSIDNIDFIRISLHQILYFQKIVNQMNSLIYKLENMSINPNIGNQHILALNNISAISVYLQVGLNSIVSGLDRCYDLDISYLNSIDNIPVLVKFIKSCISGNIPSKYIAKAAYDISDAKIKGDSTSSSPVLGTGRLVFYPSTKNDIVYKVAINNLGIKSNKTEFILFKSIKNTVAEKKFAPTITTYAHIVNEQKRGVPISITENERDNHIRDIYRSLNKAKLNIKIGDINTNGFCRINGNVVLADYGLMEIS